MTKKRRLSMICLSLLTAAIMVPSTLLAEGNQGTASTPNKSVTTAQAPVYQNVSVHDPSIVKDGDSYYVFGSHIEAAKSKDLISWTRFTNGYTTPGNTLYGDLSANLSESFAWAGRNDSDSKGGYAVWAPDVFWNKDYLHPDGSKGAYMMYYSASSTYIRSAIGFAVSKQIEGPYTYGGTVVYSGFTRDDAKDKDSVINKKWTNTNISKLIRSGTFSNPRPEWFNADGSYANLTYPNAIDANLFYDSKGKLHMVYGSWSGGIFELEVNPRTGMPIYPGQDGITEDGRLIDRYFGTKIAGGYGKSGEGPYVVYNKETGYYYLYVTYGWLGADGGYNMRVFRSKQPEGPYVDSLGQNAVLPGNIDNAPYGNKLIGNYLFDRKVGDPGTGSGVGYVSPGHNSVYQDTASGRAYLVFHSRFPQTGEMHELRVHQIFMNEQGWPLIAPYHYGGESLSKADRQDVIGDYKLINHGRSNSADIQHASSITLNKNNTVTGAVQGTWKRTGQYQASLTLSGVTYEGVFLRQWDPVSQQRVMTFTALSKDGTAIWGSKLPNEDDREVVADVVQDLTLGDTSQVVANLSLPTEGSRQTTISWTTSNADVVTTAGEIHRPASGSGNKSVVLTAIITKGKVTATKRFDITVLPYSDAKLTARYSFENDLKDGTGSYAAGTITGSKLDQTGGKITYTDGHQGKAASFDGASGIRLPDGLISSSSYSVSLWVKPEQLSLYTTTFFGAKDSTNWVSVVPMGPASNQTMVWSGSETWYDAAAGPAIQAGEWTQLAFSVDRGTLTVYVNGVAKFTGSHFKDLFTGPGGTFSLGVNWWDPPFQGLIDELTLYEGALTPQQAADLAKTSP
ncbi:LamG-like jellyroll fold domain-containing protein [Paenibacillus sp. JX-17]|uniref:LamG-like jellyroll fold domain-containing protein n=1 Tax=Paenibacillus lacisoli TaxID=3064525 RepID=A0ABT9CEI6_9BACL|nr:glycoside hydrolase family 43 C-terminal domain-containing protein [Paenibacillus sp. JX-17]MDO7907684.1 LamG-like jellyroll fold domain-containing protein [Paenibacillus sp. JX-17]